MNESRGNLYLLTGLIIGLALGLLISLVLSPVQYSDTEPRTLTAVYKDEYRRLIALAYAADGNLPRAQARLSLLEDADPSGTLAAQAQRLLGEGGLPDEARALAELAAALVSGPAPIQPGETPTPGGDPGPTAQPSPTLAEGVRTATPVLPTATMPPTLTPRATATPLQVQDTTFDLVNQMQVCDTSLPPATLAVLVSDRTGRALAGVRVVVTWPGGQDSFYTGLNAASPGYADFSMTAGVTYTVRIGEAGKPVPDLSIPACGGGWRLEFQERGG